MLSAGLILVLIGVSVALWRTSAEAFLKSDRKGKLLGDLQVASVALRRAAWSASRESFAFLDQPDRSGLSFLSPRAPRQTGSESVELDPARLALVWRKYEVFYLEVAQRTLFQREIPVPVGHPVSREPLPIDLFDPGSGALPLAAYASAGRPLCRDVTDFTARWQDGAVQVTLAGLSLGSGQRQEERVQWEVVLWPRN